MISSVSSLNFNTNYRPAFSAQENAPQPVKADNINKIENSDKKDSFLLKAKNMSPERKTLVMFGIGAALIAAGILVKKAFKPKTIVNPAVKDMLETPKEFNKKYVNELIERMKTKSNLKEGDAIYCIPRKIFKDVFGHNTDDMNKICDYLKISENGFVAAPARNTNGILQINNFSEFKFIDPETNTILAFVNEIKNGKLVPLLV